MRRCLLIVVALCVIAVAIPVARKLWLLGELGAVGVHMRSVTNELAQWEREYARITDDQAACRAIDMLHYTRHYYVPREGYRSNPETEEALENQRHRT